LQQPGDTATAAATLATGAAIATGWMAMASRSFCIENKMRENKMRHPRKQTKPCTVSGSHDCLGLDGGRDFGWLSQHDTSRICSCVTLHVLHTLYLNTDQLAALLIIQTMPITCVLIFARATIRFTRFMVHCSALKTSKLQLILLDVLDKKDYQPPKGHSLP
jgi:hypothetical protein